MTDRELLIKRLVGGGMLITQARRIAELLIEDGFSRSNSPRDDPHGYSAPIGEELRPAQSPEETRAHWRGGPY